MKPKLIKIETTDDFLMILYFENNEVKTLDFGKEDLSGSLTPLKNKEFFKKAYLSEFGMVEFPDDIQLDPYGLYVDSTSGDSRKTKIASSLKKALKKVLK